jgi:hypothetical protein
MRLVFSTGASAAAAALFCTVAFAQTTGQPSSQPQSPSASSSQQEQQVTIIGCVQREADYRRAKDAGRGGVAGSGVGAGNEFVLVNASMSSESERASASASPAETPTGTAGGAGKAFELTGPNEGQLEQHIGRRVEITGKLKPAEAGASGPTGGPTAGTPPSGVDVTSKDLKLRELEVTSVRASSGTCPSQ